VILVGERINTVRPSVARAVEAHDAAFFEREVRLQAEAGVEAIDLCCAGRYEREAEDMKWLIELAQSVTETPLSIDSSNPETILAAFPVSRNPRATWINSITADPKRCGPLLPLAKEHGCPVVGLCMDETGIPQSPQSRLEVAKRLVDLVAARDIPLEQLFLDALIDPVSLAPGNGVLTLETIARLKQDLPEIKTIICLTGVSFGLPARKLLNRTFLPLVIEHGVDAIILDPLDKGLMSTLRAAEAILSQDDYCQGYLAAYRAGELGE
jgi:5-methyltetrahydrofolate--homocysteine methyltransferase